MATFYPGSLIKIGAFAFSGVHEVRIKKSLHSWVNTAVIKIPATSRILKKDGKTVNEVETCKQFKEGDNVTVQLGYNGNLVEEFRGFVVRINPNKPCEIECEGYSYQLKRNNVNRYWKSTTVKEVLQEAVKGTDIKLMVMADMPLVDFFVRDSTGAATLEYVVKKAADGALTAFFITADTLYVGLKYTEYRATRKYVLDWNVLRDNQLKMREASTDLIEINYHHVTRKGEKKKGVATNGVGRIHKKKLNHIADADWLKKLAESKLVKNTYNGFEGKITTFLEPYAEPGDLADMRDPKYGERDGRYLIESVETVFNRSGGRRIIEIGPKV
jgi:hypothetical protein